LKIGVKLMTIILLVMAQHLNFNGKHENIDKMN
jgi:hypothetical protein